ncbi:nicotinamide riboside transporter PnuC [Ruminococcus sp. 210702-SL.1.03]|uniref:nicotinamide riboside transporter PnuC n=1 Tax=Ruminococcus sp. 210702-SL.1.03 TaxID=2883233 RepID=UPI001D05EEE8|nr:nicotinamide riboside transporter PnuC [Ruminococcus sp. 210702-SL.1.03]MCB6615348.1 nicotinamide riboside transporter PnuC [Ruminococcus sp. 210702-SL.1.03]
MNDPIKTLTKMDRLLWICSLVAVFLSNILPGQLDILTLAAAMIGVTSLIFAAKGNVWAQILMIVFSILYGIISYRFRYWGEMVTYLGMTLPMAVWSMITWIRNPSAENDSEVEIQRLNRKHIVGLVIFTAAVSVVFYYTLKALGTPNMVFSTISVTTSFLAASLTMLRSSYYALGYAANDIVLIVLWILASLKDPSYIPVAVNFSIFFLNDMYGFISWKKREIRHAQIA